MNIPQRYEGRYYDKYNFYFRYYVNINPEYTPIKEALLCPADFMFMGFRLFMARTQCILSIMTLAVG